MPGVTWELTGLRGLEAKLETVSDAIKKNVEEACADTAFAVQQRAKTDAPFRRGDLARSIIVQGRGLRWRVGLEDKRIEARGGNNSGHLNPSIYGVWYEYGFVTRKIAAKPFMRPAAASQVGPHLQRIAEAMNEAVAA